MITTIVMIVFFGTLFIFFFRKMISQNQDFSRIVSKAKVLENILIHLFNANRIDAATFNQLVSRLHLAKLDEAELNQLANQIKGF